MKGERHYGGRAGERERDTIEGVRDYEGRAGERERRDEGMGGGRRQKC